MLFSMLITTLLTIGITISSFVPSDETLRLAYDRGQRFYVTEAYEQAIEKFQIVKEAEDSRFVDENKVLIRVGELDFPVKVAATFQLANSCRNLASIQQDRAEAAGDSAAAALRQQAADYFQRAAHYYQEAAQSTDLLEIQMLSQYQLLKTHFQARAYAEVVSAGRALIERFPGSDYEDEALYEMGWAHYTLKHYAEAIAAFDQLATETTADYRIDRARFQIGKSYYEQGQYDAARQTLEQLVAKYNFSHLSEGERVKMKAQKLSGVVKETALELVAKAQLLIGDTYTDEGDIEQAAAAYRRVISDYPQERQLVEDAYVKIGWAHFAQGDLEAGIQVYRRASDEVSERGFRARMQARIARQYYEAEQFPKALEEYQIYLEAYGDIAGQGELDLDRARFQTAQCLFEMAEERRNTGDQEQPQEYYRQAQEVYLRVIADYPSTTLKAESLFGAGLAAQRRGEKADQEKALELFGQVQAQYRQQSEIAGRAHLQTARVYYAQKAYARAAELYKEYLERYPDSSERPQVLLELGLSYRDAGQDEEAIKALERIPLDAALWSKAGLLGSELLLRQNRLDEAEALVQRGLTSLRRGEAAGELYYVLAKIHFEQKNYAAALEAFTRARQESGVESILQGTLLGRGTTYYQMADYERAARDLEELLADNPPLNMKDQAHRLLGQAYVKMGRRAEAIKAYQIIIETTQDPQERAEFTLLLAELYYGLERYQEAIEQAQTVIDADFEDQAEEGGYFLKDRAYFVMGNAHTRLENHQEARQVFSRALERFPRSAFRADLLFGKAAAAFALGDYGLGAPLLQEFIASYPDSPNLENAHYFLAYSYLRQTAFEEAARWFGRLAERFANSAIAPEALFQQGETLFNLTSYTEAATAYTRVLDKYPESEFADNALYNLGWCYFELKRTEEAMAQFSALLARFPQSPFAVSAQFSLGDYYFNQQDYDKAVLTYQKIVEDYPNSEMVPQAKRLLQELREIQAYPKYEEAMQLFDKQDYTRAAAALEKIIADYPGTEVQAGAMANLGMSYEYLNKWKEAARVYQQLIETYGESGNIALVEFAKNHLDWLMTYRL